MCPHTTMVSSVGLSWSELDDSLGNNCIVNLLFSLSGIFLQPVWSSDSMCSLTLLFSDVDMFPEFSNLCGKYSVMITDKNGDKTTKIRPVTLSVSDDAKWWWLISVQNLNLPLTSRENYWLSVI